MIDTLTSNNWRDWVSRYVGTFGFFLNKNDASTRPILVYVSSVTESEATFIDSKGKNYTAYIDSGLLFKFIPVNRGFFRCSNGHLYYMERRPVRQWRRGICTANTRIARMYGTVFKDVAANSYFSVLENVFVNPTEFEESAEKDDIKFSKQFASSDGAVHFYRQHIGRYDKEKKLIELSQHLLEHELSEQAARLGIKVVVV